MTDKHSSPGSELLPCPFCGSAARYVFEEDVWHLARCDNRKCGIQGGIFPTKPMAIRSWNTRVVAQGVTDQATEEQIFDCLYANIYADNDGVAGLSSFVEELLEKFDVRSKASPLPSTESGGWA